ncbi:glycerate kinase [Vibrio natriegens]|uniref:Glycerate kinase n=1 Tax=Vibrio natriegens NBRC 15636 = ATCC 14048 = DSM 759 TaxID=1219067 RepID=A0AAN0Y6W1_VIBNA|nr:glycerate kinase [Vibrio natriegens]ALR17614.1 glycerate kinase [Vibrio natriegens NBRC 15636 = ATCC 14048 = DSM 759]ANQ15105.1 glycerate kinase [Vibrio natriegens NBRC 15636 = ATCC 14048 = DSM 759]EPM40103.1 glycerate kinase [Vibrio natriegens NBRC 15636 = ATCC 14048 = DSM 759]MDX6029556.1 glycerate kinase [Vibrio natriegens NBRC 15636 = ATCC 14048 = DSM 759]UUI13749.1 glycerate kinase [Vibrio natriegens]
MKVVIAPDSFKESLTAKQVSESIKAGLARVWHDAEFVTVPVADGGEGTVQSLIDATQGQQVFTTVFDPLNKEVQAFYGILGDGETAVIEMAEASGLHLVPAEDRDPKLTSSFGTGQLIKHALDRGMQRLIIGLGGSATNDGGVGMLSALGVKFLDESGNAIATNGGGLINLASIDTSGLDVRLAQCEILVACDVDNPLCGEKGASATFGPQKGATTTDISVLDNALRKFGELTEQVTGKHVLTREGAGAAGGMGAALLGYTPARLQPGIEIVLETVKLADHVADADIVFTGEGRIDHQTAHGKTPMGVAKVAKQFNLPVIALAGCVGDNYQAVYQCGIDAVFPCVPRAMSLADAMTEAETNVANLAENVARLWTKK